MKKNISIKTILLIIAALFAVAALLPLLGASQYLLRASTNIIIYSMLALSLNIIVGYSGQVSMGHAAFMAIGAYTFAILTNNYSWSFFPAMGAAVIASAIAGLLLGIPTLRLSDAYFVIATTGFSELVKVITLNWRSVTNGASGIKNILRPTVFGIELTNANGGQYWFALFWLAVTLYVSWALKYSKMGRSLFAIKNDSLAATMMGINTSKEKVIAFVISSMLAGVAGVLYASLTRYIEPNTFTADVSTIILCIVIFGGLGSIPGEIIGGILLIAFPEVLRTLATYRFIIYGVILIVMMRFRPQGMLGGLSKFEYRLPKGVTLEEKEEK